MLVATKPSSTTVDRGVYEHVHEIAEIRRLVNDARKVLRVGHPAWEALGRVRRYLVTNLRLVDPVISLQFEQLWRDESLKEPVPTEPESLEADLLHHAFSGHEESLRAILAQLHNEFGNSFNESNHFARA